jgi:flagellar biosynthesis activator protein FlaF
MKANQAADIYKNLSAQIASPRELEAKVLLDAAARLQTVKDNWSGGSDNLDAALRYNRKLWTLFVSSVTSSDNPLAQETRQNVASLGLFVFKQTLTVLADPKPENLGSLININRQIAAGLLGHAA